MTNLVRSIEEIAKKQHLVRNSILPVIPGVTARSHRKIVRDISIKQFIMKIDIYLVEEVAVATIENNSQFIWR